MTYVQLVNSVLRRLRETEVTSVQDNSYAKLIGDFVNDAKRLVEDAYDWNALTETLTVSTTNDIFSYGLTGSGQRFKVIDIIDDTSNIFLQYKTTVEMDQLFLIKGTVKGRPQFYNFNGVTDDGDTRIDIYPIPDGVYQVRVNIYKPTPALSANTDKVLVPSEPIIFNATARAMSERGEDGGIASTDMYALYQQSLADAISLESSRHGEEQLWNWV